MKNKKEENMPKKDKARSQTNTPQNEPSWNCEDENYHEVNLNSFQKNFNVLIGHYKQVTRSSKSH